MILAIIAVIVLAIALIVAFAIGLRGNSKAEKEEDVSPAILNSGIYSVVRRSPSESISRHKPSNEQIAQYLAQQNEDYNGQPLTDKERIALRERFAAQLKENIAEIEAGDKLGVEFYYYDFPRPDPVCAQFITQGRFVTREELHKFPGIIPPFHVGCTLKLKQYSGSENLRKTTELNMLPFFHADVPPPLPDWKQILVS